MQNNEKLTRLGVFETLAINPLKSISFVFKLRIFSRILYLGKNQLFISAVDTSLLNDCSSFKPTASSKLLYLFWQRKLYIGSRWANSDLLFKNPFSKGATHLYICFEFSRGFIFKFFSLLRAPTSSTSPFFLESTLFHNVGFLDWIKAKHCHR